MLQINILAHSTSYLPWAYRSILFFSIFFFLFMKASYVLVNPIYTGNPVSGTVENSGYPDKMYQCLHCLL